METKTSREQNVLFVPSQVRLVTDKKGRTRLDAWAGVSKVKARKKRGGRVERKVWAVKVR